MGQSAPSVVPEGYYPPFAVITDEDKGGWIIIATALGMAMALLSTGLRVYVKIMSRHQGGLDDLCLAAGTVFAFAQQGVVLGACSHGLGRTVDLLSSTELRNVEKSFYASQLLTILALGLCKSSIAYFIMRLTPQTSVRTVLYVFLICTALWIIASIFTLALQCDLHVPWSLSSGACEGVYRRLLAVGILDIVLEVALFACAVLLVSRLQTKFLKKFMVIIAFGLRLPIIVVIIVRLTTFDADSITDFSRTASLYVVWTVTQINFSLVSTTLPILKPFIRDLNTFYGALQPNEYSRGSSYATSYALSQLKSKRSDGTQGRSKKTSASDAHDSVDLGTGLHQGSEPAITTKIHAMSTPSRSDTTRSQNSIAAEEAQTMFIHVDTQWEVSVARESTSVRPYP